MEKFFLREQGSKLFSRDSLVLFMRQEKIILIGVVKSKNIVNKDQKPSEANSTRRVDDGKRVHKQLSVSSAAFHPKKCLADYLEVAIDFFDHKSRATAIQLYCNCLQDSDATPDSILQAPVSFFRYQPILHALQQKVDIPFREEILLGQSGCLLPDEQYDLNCSIIQDCLAKLESDPDQRTAVQHALSNRVTLIHGPPGTGKTYVGVQITRALLANPRTKILCLCYTNHAIDDFLLSLVSEGGVDKNDILRIGNSPKLHEDLKPCTLRDRKMTLKPAVSCAHYYYYLIRLQKELLEKFDHKCKRLKMCANIDRLPLYLAKQCMRPDYVSVLFPTEICVGKKGKIARDAVFKRWCSGQAPYNREHENHELWNLTKMQRAKQIMEWKNAYTIQLAAQCLQLQANIKVVNQQLKNLRNLSESAALRCSKIIGSTITGASKYIDLIEEARPDVIIVEEAGEILEADLLACLVTSAKRLILIGDYQQLRPKLEVYALRKASGCGIDFDISLFERLCSRTMGYSLPVCELNIQYRMRPEISNLLRQIAYPALEDASQVKGRPDIKGVSSNLAFINHNEPESEDKDFVVTSNRSKTNKFEVEHCVEIVRHFQRQGYDDDEIVVLTPYLGQMRSLNQALQEYEVKTTIGDLDAEELKRENIALNMLQVDSKGVRVATIDNYQGEEARIIIVSLVRSNASGDIGFLSEIERIVVMFSRARDGLFIVGNQTTYESARSQIGRQHWTNVFKLLSKDNRIFSGFPAYCSRHQRSPDVPILTRKDFSNFSPTGGCPSPCGAVMLSCQNGHLCNLHCHDEAVCDHSTAFCKFLVSRNCAAGRHVLDGIECSSSTLPKCTKLVTTHCPEGHSSRSLCHSTFSEIVRNCRTCAKIEQERKDAELKCEADLKGIRDEITSERAMLALELSQAAFAEEKLRLLKEKSLIEEQRKVLRAETLDRLTLDTEEEFSLSTQQSSRSVPRSNSARLSDVSTIAVSTDTAMNNPRSEENASINNQHKDIHGKVFDPSVSQQNYDEDRIETKYASSSFALINELDSLEIDCSLRSTTGGGTGAGGRTRGGTGDGDNTGVNAEIGGRIGGAAGAAVGSKSGAGIRAGSRAGDGTTAVGRVEAVDTELESIFMHLAKNDIAKLGKLATTCLQYRRKAINILLDINLERLRDSEKILSLYNSSMFEQTQSSDPLNQLVVALLADKLGGTYGLIAKQFAKNCLDNIRAMNISFSTGATYENVKRIKDLSITDIKQASDITNAEKSSSKARTNDSTVIETKLRQLTNDPKHKSLLDLLGLVGLEEVKGQFVDLHSTVQLSSETHVLPSNLNTRFEGNPGTGKTTVARIYSQFLQEIGIISKESIFKEFSASQLKNGGIKLLEDTLDAAKKAGGAVIFVDEAYQLNPHMDISGRTVLDFLLTHAERLDHPTYGKLIWIFAGYSKELEKMFEHNPGLPSRFPKRYVFEDYTDTDLQKILRRLFDVPLPPPGNTTKANAANNTANPSYPANLSNQNRSSQQDLTDELGNVWTWDSKFNYYKDDYGNCLQRTDYLNKQVMRISDNSIWYYNRSTKKFTNNINSEVLDNVPGFRPKSTLRTFRFDAEERHCRIACRRLGMRRGPGFGNSRAVRNLFDQIMERYNRRINTEREMGQSPPLHKLERDDILGPMRTTADMAKCPAWCKLMGLEGLNSVKQEIQSIVNMVLRNAQLEDEEKPLVEINLNRVFLGNPGTGKTTVASLYGQILNYLGLLSKGETILKNPSDFKGDVVGASEEKTRSILKQAEGSVLIIDEAYMLSGGGKTLNATGDIFGQAVLDTIVEQVQGRPGDDRVVIMAGYQEQMESMFRGSNPGLSRRFQFENPFYFEDYDDLSLVRILFAECDKRKVYIDTSTAFEALSCLSKARSGPNFGNAGAVITLVTNAHKRQQDRIYQATRAGKTLSDEFLLCDFETDDDRAKREHYDPFSDLVGFSDVKQKIDEIRATVTFCQESGHDPKDFVPFSYLFLGSPGTGKTTIARRMGQLFCSLGLLPYDEVVEVSLSTLVTGYANQAGIKTTEMFNKAKGKVLFIDEAYQLNPTTGGPPDVVDEIVRCLTDEKFKNKLIVIMAGYEDKMNAFLRDANPGLQSRFPERFYFHNFSIPECSQMLLSQFRTKGVNLNPALKKEEAQLSSILEPLVNHAAFSNGRDIDALCKSIITKACLRTKGCDTTVDFVDIFEAVQQKVLDLDLTSKPPTTEFQMPLSAGGTNSLPSMTQHAFAPPAPRTTVAAAAGKPSTLPHASEVHDEFPSPDSTPFDVALQDIVTALGLNNKYGATAMATWSEDSKEFKELATKLAAKLNLNPSDCVQLILQWQAKHNKLISDLSAIEQEKEIAKQTKRKARVPLYRCAVCGRSNQPFVACWVAPYISGFIDIDP